MTRKTSSISFEPRDEGLSVIDGKTPISFGVGLLAGMSGLNASWSTVVVLGFEAFLVTISEGSLAAPFERRGPQSYGNQLVDILAGIAGVYYGEKLQAFREAEARRHYAELLAKNKEVLSSPTEPDNALGYNPAKNTYQPR